MDLGSKIGQYRLVRKIGAGGMGTVFVGEHILLGRRAAIKTLLPMLTQQPEIVERFFNEARATSAISDPGVVQVFDFGYHVDGSAYIVMELLEGEALSARLDRLGTLAAPEALRITRQVAGALAAAHAQGIIHRDLKPENVFLIRDPEAKGGERAKLLDFGICKLDREDVTATQIGAMLGTPVYMSPEQCQGTGTIDHRSDIYGLGCVLFHMVTGAPPFDGTSTGELIVAHLQHAPPAPSSVVAGLPPAIDALVARCLAKSPDDRFAWMTELQDAIEQVLPALEVEPPAPAEPAPAKVALGAGFQSEYDGNLELSRIRRLAPDWFVTPTPTTLGSASGETELPERRSGARPIIAIVACALVATLIAANHAMTGARGTDEAPSASVLPATAPPVVEPAPVAPSEPASAPRPAAGVSREASPAQPAPAKAERARSTGAASLREEQRANHGEPRREHRSESRSEPRREHRSEPRRVNRSEQRREHRKIERRAPRRQPVRRRVAPRREASGSNEELYETR